MLTCPDIQVPQIPNHYVGTPEGGMTVYYIPGYPPYQKVTAFPKVGLPIFVSILQSLTRVYSYYSVGLQDDHRKPHDPEQGTL